MPFKRGKKSTGKPDRRRVPPEPPKKHVHDMQVAGTVTRPDESTVTYWKCTSCPYRAET